MAPSPTEPTAMYLPTDRGKAVSAGAELGADSTGAVLLADFGGFTSLTEALVASLGSRHGAEVLITHLNSLYDTIIDEIHRYGGVVVDFSGDAVNCWFGPHPGTQPAHRAVSAALGMQRRLSWRDPLVVGGVPFADVELKVGIASGATQRHCVGNPEIRLMDVISGRPVFDAARLEKLANVGQILIDPATMEDLGSGPWGVLSTRVASGDFLIDQMDIAATPCPTVAVHADASRLTDWIDYQLRTESRERTAELRTVVTLFVRFWQSHAHQDGATIDPVELAAVAEKVQDVADRHGGSLIQLTIGDKGGYAFCSFGAPVARKELSDLALACALELRSFSAQANQNAWTIGISRGTCRTGYYGGRTRRTYGVIGDCTNIAARLMAVARPGTIVVTDDIRVSTKRSMQWTEVEPVELAGQPKPIVAYEVEGYRITGDEGRQFRPLVGRSTELTHLVEHLERALTGVAETVMVTGETGSGKSHLIEAARRELLESSNARWLEITAEESNSMPMHPFVSCANRVFYQELSEDRAVQRELFDAALDDLIDQTGAINTSISAELSAARTSLWSLLTDEPPLHTTPEKWAGALGPVVRALATERPLVVHVQDWQWMDPGSREALHQLMAQAMPAALAMVITVRGNGDSARTTAANLPSTLATHHIELRSLNEDQTREFGESVVGRALDQSVVKYLVDVAVGNPLYVESVLTDLEQRRLLTLNESGQLHFEEGTPSLSLPQSLVPILTARLDRLPADVKATVQLASALGRTFSIDHLRRMSLRQTGADGEIDDAVRSAEEHGIWQCNGGECTFGEPLLRTAASNLYLESEARRQMQLATTVVRAAEKGKGAEQALTLELPNVRGAEKGAMDAVAALAQAHGLPTEHIEDLRTATSEACINAMLHGNAMSDESFVTVRITVDEAVMVIDVIDENVGRTDVGSIAITAPNMEAQVAGLETPGGMGLFVIGQLTSSASFFVEPGDARTTFRMIFDL